MSTLIVAIAIALGIVTLVALASIAAMYWADRSKQHQTLREWLRYPPGGGHGGLGRHH